MSDQRSPAVVVDWGLKVQSLARRPSIFLGLAAGGLLAAFIFLFVLDGQGVDAYAYWRAAREDPYSVGSGFGAFHYTPPIVIFLRLIAFIPWPAFYWCLTAANLAALAWIGRRWTFALLAFPPVVFELYHGNIHLLLAAAIVAGVRWPGTWAFVLLTKIAPGIGIVWFAVRREWRSLAIACAATGLVILVTVPWFDLWPAWFRHLAYADGLQGPWYLQVPFPLRLGAAFLVVVWGARSSRYWTLPIAATLALPLLWLNGLAILVAIVPLARWRPEDARAAAPTAAPGVGQGQVLAVESSRGA